MNTLKIIINIGLVLLLGGLFNACKQDAVDSLALNADVHVLAFKVASVNGVVDNEAGTITGLVPAGTDLSAVAPVIDLPANAAIKPASGIVQNFQFSASSPVVDRVYNGKLFNAYRVTVKENKAEITAFHIANRTGILNLNDDSIVIYLPAGTDLTQLRSMVECADRAKIAPAQGIYVD